MNFRNWEITDYVRIAQTLNDSHIEYNHKFDGEYRIALAQISDLNHTQLCEDEDGNILGWAMLGSWQFFDLFSKANTETYYIQKKFIEWALKTWGQGPGSKGRHIWIGVNEYNQAQQRLLCEYGFELDSWCYGHLKMSLLEELPEPKLPKNFSIHPLGGLSEVSEVVRLHQEAFGSDFMTDVWRQQILRMPGYRNDLDLVVVSPDGKLAAYCLFWLRGEEAQLEPLAVRPEYQGLGLSKALIYTGLKYLQVIGVNSVHVEHDYANEKSTTCYYSCGFQTEYKNLQYVARFPRA